MEEYNNNLENKSVPKGYVPLRDTLTQAGESVGYNQKNGNPIVNGQEINKNSEKLAWHDGKFWADGAYADSLKTQGYVSKYDNQKDTLISRLMKSSFSYTPDNDESLKMAQSMAMQNAAQRANSRGMYGGTTSTIMQQRAAQELIPQYENLAYQKYLSGIEKDKATLEAIDKIDDDQITLLKHKNDVRQSNADSTFRKEEAVRDSIEFESDAELKNRQFESDAELKKRQFESDAELKKLQIDNLKYDNDYKNALKKFQIYGTIDDYNKDILGIEYNQPTWEVMEFLDLIFGDDKRWRG